MTFRTVEWMQERLHTLHDEIDCLKYEAEKAAADERAKIVAYIREMAENTGKDAPKEKQIDYSVAWGSLLVAAIGIEEGAHLT